MTSTRLKLIAAAALAMLISAKAAAQHTLTLDTKARGFDIAPTMYGVFFEDINFGADGGLYAELVENRSFEFPNHLQGWNTFGKVSVSDYEPAFERTPNYITLSPSGHTEKRTGVDNHGFFGMGFVSGKQYDFSVYARLNRLQGKEATLQVELLDDASNVIGSQKLTIGNNRWARHSATLTANKTIPRGFLRITLLGDEPVDLDHISLFPSDNWHGLRPDLVKALEDLHPGVMRFPGGCIVEGTDLATRYQWKKTVGQVENRPINENRWRDCMSNRIFPNYYQSGGLGFYEFFLLAEKIGADPLPILSCGLACQYQNRDDDPNAHVALSDLQPYIDDALDLIEFCNGDTTTEWGSLRAQMGHLAPFNLHQIGIGNEQWGPLYPERLELFVKAIRAKYPNIKIVGSSGPSADGDKFDYGWKEMRRIGVDLVDEHYYKAPEWFLANATRYDSYPRRGPKVFAGEYAAHNKQRSNNWQTALAEACFMTGLERNADVVRQATYAPLFAHVDGWQWRPDLIWFDNLNCVRSANWQVQMLYSTNCGTATAQLTSGGKALTGQDSLYASAVRNGKEGFIVKIGNAGGKAQSVGIDVKGLKQVAEATAQIVTAPLDAENTLQNKEAVAPKPYSVNHSANTVSVQMPPYSFVVIKIK